MAQPITGVPLTAAQALLVPQSRPFWDPSARPQGAPGAPYVIGTPSAWDTVFLAGRPVPGVVRLDGYRQRRVDAKPSLGTDGATLTHTGHDPSEIQLKITIWTPEQLADYEEVLKIFATTIAGKAPPPPVDIAHPALAIMGITSVYPKKVTFLRPTGVKGAMEAEWHFTEFVPKQAATSTSIIDTPKSSRAIASKKHALGTQPAVSSPDKDSNAAKP